LRVRKVIGDDVQVSLLGIETGFGNPERSDHEKYQPLNS
jgi:hypothetical protein